MKTIFKLVATALLLTITLSSSAQSWQWGKRGGSGGSSPGDKVVDMATDQNGNVYVLSVCSAIGTVNVDGHPGITPYDRLSVASWSCNGEFRWLKMFGSGSLATGDAIHVDTLGGVYIAGTMSSSASSFGGPGYFDTDTVLPASYKRMYVIKYDTGGNYQWLKMPEPDTIPVGERYSGVLDMDGTLDGDLYLYTILRPGVYYDDAFTVADTGMYVWKMNKEGVFQSATRLDVTVSGTYINRYGYDNLVRAHFTRDHHSGRYYLGGWYISSSGNLTIGTTPVYSSATIGYLAAFSASGNALWVRQADTSSAISSISVDESSIIYASGTAVPSASFNGNTFINESGLGQVAYVVAMDSMGNNIWGTNSSGQSIADNGGIVYVNNTLSTTGRYGKMQWQGQSITSPPGVNYVYLARFNATTGTIIGLDSLATGGLNNFGLAITADKNGNLFVGGSFDAAVFVASDTLLKTGGPSDWFVAKFGTANCNCTLPIANFSYSTSGTAIHFSYSGSGDYSSISWDFGDGATSSLPNPSHTFSDTGSHMVCVTVINDCGSNIYCLEVEAPTGIENTGSAAAGVKVYPNPASQSITVAGAGSGSKLSLYDVTGALVLEQSLQSSLPVSLNISQLPDGVYILQFTDSKGKRGMTRVVKR